MSQIYLGDKIIASTLGSDIKYDENTSVNDKIDEHATLIDEQNKKFIKPIDVTKLIVDTISTVSDASYTATEDCWIKVRLVAWDGKSATAKINDVTILGISSDTTGSHWIYETFYIPKGTVVNIVGSGNTAFPSQYTVYGCLA